VSYSNPVLLLAIVQYPSEALNGVQQGRKCVYNVRAEREVNGGTILCVVR
jgi:hypothetical protein